MALFVASFAGTHHELNELSTLMRRSATPLPKRQMLALCIARLAEPIAYSCIFPFINEAVSHLPNHSLSQRDIGFYSGVIEGAFASAQVFTVYAWGAWSDRVGRKPVILIGLLGVGGSITLFGLLSNSFWGMVFARGMNGALSGNGSVIKAALGEVTDRTNEGLAFPLFSLQWSLGLVIGPLIGGFLSHPNDRFPSVFHGSAFFGRHPYLLPCLVAGAITFLGALLTGLLLEETLESKLAFRRAGKSSSSSETSPLLDPPRSVLTTQATDEPPTALPRWTFWKLAALPDVRRVLVSYYMLSWLANSYDSLFVLFAYSSADNGGLSLPPTQIATIMSLGGVFSALFQTLLLPRLHLHHGTTRLYTTFLSFYPLVFALPPLIAAFTSPLSTLRWFGVGLLVVIVRLGAMAFPLNMIALNAAAPEKGALGAVNAIAQLLACASRSFGPMVAGALYALSNRARLPIVWGFYGSFSLLSIYLATKVKGRSEESEEEVAKPADASVRTPDDPASA